ncbi:MAG: Rieske (2Fe-2S) protein [Acidimicrobiia bacterium]
MSDFVFVAKVGSIPEGQAETFTVGGRLVAVFNDGGAYYALDDACPHMGASLAAGPLSDGIVVCPWHAWRFCVRDGSWCDDPSLKADCFEVRVEGDEIQVRVPDECE